MKKLFFWILIVSGCTKQINQEPTNTLSEQETRLTAEARLSIPDQIRFTRPGLYPEGIAFDKFNNRFLVSSFTTGTIGIVTFDGVYKLFIQDPDLHSSLGLKIDEARKQIVTAGGFANNGAQLGVYDLQTGSRIRLIDLGALRPNAAHAADDVAIDPEGNKYVTDAKSPIVYKIDLAGHASIFFENDRYAEPPGFPYIWVGFNGIAYDNNGFLIVGFYAGGKLLRIPVKDPGNYAEVQLDAEILSPDGLLISKDGKRLIVVDNKLLSDASEIIYLSSDDNWVSGKLVTSFPTGLVSPTTAASDGKNVFVIDSYLHKVFFEVDFSQSEFMIQKMPFESTQAF